MFYLIILSGLLLIIFLLLAVILFYYLKTRTKRQWLLKQLEDTEKAINYGFIQLKHDLAAEIAMVQRSGASHSREEMKVREEQLQEDIKLIETLISKEISEVKHQ